MKTLTKKHLILAFSALLTFATATAQENDSRLKLHALSVNLGGAYFDQEVGLSAGLDLDFSSGDHIFKLMAMGTTALGIFTDDSLDNAEYSLLYGRESILSLGGRTGLDAFAGLGYVRYELRGIQGNPDRYVDSLGVPLLIRARYQAGDHIGLGVQTHANFHAGPDIFTAGFFLQYRF